jgi:hypothetical protein
LTRSVQRDQRGINLLPIQVAIRKLLQGLIILSTSPITGDPSTKAELLTQ